MKNMIRTLLCSTLFLTSLACNGANIIFDLGGVIFDTDEKTAVSKIGVKELAAYGWAEKSIYAVVTAKDRLFEILMQLKPLENPALDARDDAGRLLPQYLRDWLAGTMTLKNLSTEILAKMQQQPNLFHSTCEKTLMENIVKMMFTPQHFIQTRTLIADGIAFAKKCKAQGHKLYIFSNWDAESFLLLCQKYPELEKIFDGGMISGNLGIIKPDPLAFTKLLEEYNLKPEECIFLDDQQENISAATALNMKTILIKKSAPFYAPWSQQADFSPVEKEFKQLLAKIS